MILQWISLALAESQNEIMEKLKSISPDYRVRTREIAISYRPKSYYCYFLLAVVVSASENTCIEMFFNKFESNKIA